MKHLGFYLYVLGDFDDKDTMQRERVCVGYYEEDEKEILIERIYSIIHADLSVQVVPDEWYDSKGEE